MLLRRGNKDSALKDPISLTDESGLTYPTGTFQLIISVLATACSSQVISMEVHRSGTLDVTRKYPPV